MNALLLPLALVVGQPGDDWKSAEAAYLTYLKKLDDVAHLEVAGAYLEQRQAGNPDDEVLHLVARYG